MESPVQPTPNPHHDANRNPDDTTNPTTPTNPDTTTPTNPTTPINPHLWPDTILRQVQPATLHDLMQAADEFAARDLARACSREIVRRVLRAAG